MKKEKILQFIKRVKESGLRPDTDEAPGDLYTVSSWFSDNGVLVGARYGMSKPLNHYRVSSTESTFAEKWCVLIHKDSADKEKEILEVLAAISDTGYAIQMELLMGVHTLAKAHYTKHRPTIPMMGNILFEYTRPARAKKLPYIRYDIRDFFPPEMVDEKGDFVWTFKNYQKYGELQASDVLRNNNQAGKLYCYACRTSYSVTQIKESSIEKILRSNNNISLITKCPHCEKEVSLRVVLPEMQELPYAFRHVTTDIRIADNYIVRTRRNGGYSRGKLCSIKGDNILDWAGGRAWGRVIMPSLMKYAAKQNIPVEV